MVDTTVILAGAIPAALLALAVDGGLLWLERRLSPRRRRTAGRTALAVAAALASAILIGSVALTMRDAGAIVVGSKNFTEQLVLGEILAQAIERETGLTVQPPAQSRRHADLRPGPCHRRHRRLRRIHRHGADGDLPPAAVRPIATRSSRPCAGSTPTAAARSCRRSASTIRSPSWCAAPTRAQRGLRTIDDVVAPGAALAGRLRLRVPRAGRRVSRSRPDLRAHLPRAASGDGPGADAIGPSPRDRST